MSPDVQSAIVSLQREITFLYKVIAVVLALKLVVWAGVIYLLIFNQRLTVHNNELLKLCKGYIELTEESKRQSREQLLSKVGDKVAEGIKTATDNAASALSHSDGIQVVLPVAIVPPPEQSK